MEPTKLYDQFGQPIETAPNTNFPWKTIVFCLLVSSFTFGFILRPGIEKAIRDENRIYGTSHLGTSSLETWRPALADATQEWRKALPNWTIAIPLLKLATQDECGTKNEVLPIACASPKEYTVWLVRDQTLWDRKTIMMHEVGHLLGVPHIEDDELMNAQYLGKLDVPTPLSVHVAAYTLKKAAH